MVAEDPNAKVALEIGLNEIENLFHANVKMEPKVEIKKKKTGMWKKVKDENITKCNQNPVFIFYILYLYVNHLSSGGKLERGVQTEKKKPYRLS